MHLVQIMGLVVRLFAVFLVVYNLRYANSVIALAMAQPPDYLSSVIILVLGFIPMVVAILLWAFPLAIASTLIPEIKTTQSPTPIQGDELQIVAFSVLGLWLLATAVHDLFYWAAFVYRLKAVSFPQPELSPENIGAIVATAVELVVGVLLLFGSKGIVGLVRRSRYAGG